MKKVKIFVCFFIVIGFLSCVAYGINTRLGWNNDTNLRPILEQKNLKMASIDIMEEESFLLSEEVDTFEKLYKSADIVVRVQMKPEGKRIMYTECTLSEVEAIENLKGETRENTILVFEPIYVEKGMIRAEGSYYYMEDNQEYILFLKKIKCSLYGNSSYVYLPTTTALSKYRVQDNTVTGKAYLRKEENGIVYDASKVVGYDISTNREDIIRQYEENSKYVETLIRGEEIDKK